MNKIALIPAAALAAVVGFTALRPTPQDPPPTPAPVEIVTTAEPVTDSPEVCPAPCEHCAITKHDTPVEEPSATPAVEPTRGRTPPVTVPEDPATPGRTRPVQDPPATAETPGRVPPPVVEPVPPADTVSRPVPPPPGTSTIAGGIVATVTLPDGSPWTARAPFPADPQGFTWRMFQSRTQPGKRILGLHVYAPVQEPDLIVGTVRWSNGALKPNGSEFCGAVYYDSFMLTAPAGWEWVILPQKGQTTRVGIWVVAAKPAKDSHFARPREMMEFAYALVPAGNENARARAEAALRYTNLEIPQPFLDYGPTRTRLPTVDRAKMKNICTDWTQRLLAAQAAGTKVFIENIADFQSDALGPHWMDGQPAGYAHGGFGIDPTGEFAEQVPEAVLAHAIMHRANVSRSFLAAYNIDTGLPMSLYEWTYPPNPSLMSGEPGKQGVVEVTQFLVGDYYTYRWPRFNTGKCAYENPSTKTVNGAAVYVPGLWDFDAHDIAHSIRAMRHALALVEYANDPAARDFLMLIAETNRYGWFSNRADERTPKKNPGDGYWAQTLTATREWVDAHPGQGGWFERNWAWSAFAGACAIEYERDPARKATWLSWGRDMLEARRIAADKFGFSGRYFDAGHFKPGTVSGIQTFHEMLVICHTTTLGMRVYGAVPANLAEINRRGLNSALALLTPKDYGGSKGPPHWIGTANNNVEFAAIADNTSFEDGDPAHVYAAVALTYRADPTKPEVLNLALRHWHPTPDLTAMWNFCKGLVPNKAWSVQMESVLETKLGN